jgi:hypothetical protein
VTSDPVFDPSFLDPSFDSGGDELFTVPATKIKTPKRATESEAPDSFDLSLTLRSWFKEQNLSRLGIDARFETDKFLDHHRAKGTKFRNWDAAWKNWMRNAGKFAQERGPAGNAGRPGGDRRGSGERYQRHFEHIPDEAYAAPINY